MRRSVLAWRLAGGMLLLGGMLLGGCAGPSLAERTPGADLEPARVELDTVPFHAQDAFECGPASLAMVLGWSGIATQPDALAPQVYTPSRRGTLQSALITAARRHDRVAYPITGPGALTAELSAGHPVIVLQNLGLSWYPRWHYAVAIGYDLPAGLITLHSGTTARKRVSERVFMNTWARSDYWGLVVLPPTRLPASADERSFVEAVAGLERSARYQAAATAYETALARWPDSLAARMGLGNARYAAGDLAGAEAAFRDGVRRHPEAAPAYNNLAQVLSELGRIDEARATIARAIELGGPLTPVYRRTRAEILGSYADGMPVPANRPVEE